MTVKFEPNQESMYVEGTVDGIEFTCDDSNAPDVEFDIRKCGSYFTMSLEDMRKIVTIAEAWHKARRDAIGPTATQPGP